jgi:hypothetical protein
MEVPIIWSKNTFARFQKVMDWVLTNLDFAKCYIDDIIVFSSICIEDMVITPNKMVFPMSNGIFGSHDLTKRFEAKANVISNFQD